MIPDRILNMTINNSYVFLQYKQLFYYGNFHIIITSISGPNAYFILSKFDAAKSTVFELNGNATPIQVEWENNETPKIRTIENVNNTAYNIQVKIFEM